MNGIFVSRISRIAAAGLFLAASCGSSQKVDRGEMLMPDGYKDVKATIYVSPVASQRIYQKVAVLPFKAPTDLIGSSISDLFATALLKTNKYNLVERSQMEQVLGEQALGLKGVTESAVAIRVGKMLGVQGVIVGTVPEYGSKASGASELSAIGINARMIDVSDGGVVWSVSDSAISPSPIGLSSFAKRMVDNLVSQLFQEAIKAGDTVAANLPVPQIASSRGGVRSVFIQVVPDSPEAVESYTVLRGRTESGSYQEVGKVENSSRNVSFEDRNLLDAETYHYKVVGRNRSGMTTVPSQPVRVTTVGPPDAVTGLSAQSGLIRKVILQWQASFDPNVKGYNVYRRTSGDTWAKIKTLDGQSRASYTDEGLDDEKAYTYRIAAFNVVETESPPSRTAAATTKGPPSPVTGLKAASGEARKVSLSWNPVNEPEVKGYAVYRASHESGPFEMIKSIEGREQTQFEDGGKKGYFSEEASLSDETRYYYKLRAVNVVDVESPDSRRAIAVTKPVPTPVTGIRTGEKEVKRITVEWEPNPESDIAKYEIFRGEDPASTNKNVGEVSASTYRFVDKDLKDGSTHHYRLRAVDKDGLIGKFSIVVQSSTKPLPKNPQGIKAVFDGGQVLVSWKPNPEPDIVKYAVSQKGFMFWDKAGEASGPSFAFRGEVKKGKTLTFRVTAVDGTGLESEPSEEISLVIP
ncbi:MAG: hypothetical protein A2V83_09180 [Nitrospirae bacterium RBG_16_64_22]|nr:MAG: hypothetical protein A2V83_09180 [Nitrospirae bacterium RBG_16_64_22]